MAEKYVVSKEGLVATTDSIRAKTGNAESIIWSDSKGFSDAISVIAGGSQVATGSITVAGSSTLNNSPVVISGFDFRPTQFYMYRTASSGLWLSSIYAGMDYIWSIDIQDTTTTATNSEVFMVGSNAVVVERKTEYVETTAAYGSVTLRAKTTSAVYMSGGTYNWIAIG